MTFLNPILAWSALACIAIPILIHILMRRRRTPIPFGAMRFVLEAFRRQRRRMRLEQVILLASRCLLVALLALAVGGLTSAPSGDARRGPRTLFILIDNSLTSSVSGVDGRTGLDRSRAAALELLASLDAGRGDRAALVALGSPADAIILPPTLDLGAVREHIVSLAPTDSRTDFQGALARIRDDLARAQGSSLVILSDFRAGSADPSMSLPTLPQTVAEVLAQTPAEDSPENVAIISLEPLRPVLLTGPGDEAARTTTFRVGLRRFGASSPGITRVQVRLAFQNATPPAAWATLNWAPGQSEADVIVSPEVTGGAGSRTVAIAGIDRDSIPGDNVFRRPIQTRDRLEVALLAGPGRGGAIDQFVAADWLALALSPQADLVARQRQSGEVRVSLIDPDRPALPASTGIALADADAVVLADPDLLDGPAWDAVRQASRRGALVLAFPPARAQTHLWGDAFAGTFSLEWAIDRNARDLSEGLGLSPMSSTASNLLAFLAGELVELAKPVRVTRVLTLRASPHTFETLLSLEDGTPFLVLAPATAERGPVVLCTAAMHLAWTDLPTRPLMVPLVQEIIRQGVGRSGADRTAIAGQSLLLPQGATELVRQREEGLASPGIHQVQSGGVIEPPIRTSGVYVVRGAGAASLGIIGVNADSGASPTEARSGREIAEWLGTLGPPMSFLGEDKSTSGVAQRDDRHGSPWTGPLLTGALVLAIVEAFLGRWFSHAGVREGIGRDSGVAERRTP
jgi:hypothetical protein